jgi:hypothetical protein
VALSRRAEKALTRLTVPLVAEMELYFSCLIRKAVRFNDFSTGSDATPVSPNLYLRFRPVGSRSCGLKLSDGKPQLDDFPVVNPKAYTPDWVEVDFRHGEWLGHFGYGHDR